MLSLASGECVLYGGVPPPVAEGTKHSGQSPPDSSHSPEASEGDKNRVKSEKDMEQDKE